MLNVHCIAGITPHSVAYLPILVRFSLRVYCEDLFLRTTRMHMDLDNFSRAKLYSTPKNEKVPVALLEWASPGWQTQHAHLVS